MLSGPMPAPATEVIAIEVAFARVPSGQSRRYEVPSKSISAPVQPATVGPRKQGASSASPSPLGPGVKCPISMAKLIFACKAAQGTKLSNLAVSYSGWKLKFVVAQVFGPVFRKPLAALATMNPVRMTPDWLVVRSWTIVRRPADVSLIVTRIRSPWLMKRVCALGVNVESVALPGPGGPVGTPSFWMNAKLTGSPQLGFR